MYQPFTDAQQAQGFVVSQTSNIERGVYAKRYPSFEYESLVPVVTEGNEWARTVTYYSSDIAGKSAWLNIGGGANDFPKVELSRDKHEHAFAMRGLGYEWNIEELNVARMLGQNLSDDKAMAARRLAQRFCYYLAFIGDDEKGWKGMFNSPLVEAVPVPADGTGSATYFAAKDADKQLRDVNEAIIGINTDSGEVEMANTIVFPTSVLQALASTRIAGLAITVLEFLRKNNVYTQETGQDLTIRGNRLLNNLAPGGEGRAVAYWRNPQAVRFHEPMPFRFLAPFQISSFAWEIAGIMRVGGTEIRLPGAFRYIDGISAPPS